MGKVDYNKNNVGIGDKGYYEGREYRIGLVKEGKYTIYATDGTAKKVVPIESFNVTNVYLKD